MSLLAKAYVILIATIGAGVLLVLIGGFVAHVGAAVLEAIK